jgi:hypothetical protein
MDTTTQSSSYDQSSSYEHMLLAIVRKLPPERRSELLTFARFLIVETYKTTDLDFLEDEAGVDVTNAADAHWDALLASEEGQKALEKLADEALADIRAGKASSISFTDEGEIAPR